MLDYHHSNFVNVHKLLFWMLTTKRNTINFVETKTNQIKKCSVTRLSKTYIYVSGRVVQITHFVWPCFEKKQYKNVYRTLTMPSNYTVAASVRQAHGWSMKELCNHALSKWVLASMLNPTISKMFCCKSISDIPINPSTTN